MKQFYRGYFLLLTMAICAVVIVGYLADWAVTLAIKSNHLPFFAVACVVFAICSVIYSDKKPQR